MVSQSIRALSFGLQWIESTSFYPSHEVSQGFRTYSNRCQPWVFQNISNIMVILEDYKFVKSLNQF